MLVLVVLVMLWMVWVLVLMVLVMALVVLVVLVFGGVVVATASAVVPCFFHFFRFLAGL